MGAEETLERYELWSASAQEDSTEPVASTDKETVKAKKPLNPGVQTHPEVKVGFIAPRSQCRQNGRSLPRRLFHQRSRLNWSRFLAARYWRKIRQAAYTRAIGSRQRLYIVENDRAARPVSHPCRTFGTERARITF